MSTRYVPKLPFEGYKWLFATKAPTEALGDPAVLLGLITRMAQIEDGITKYSSEKFAQILRDLDKDVITTVSLSKRVGERNLIRNSGQYWRLFGLIPTESTKGIITLTPLARKIASGSVSQLDFATSMLLSVKLPNEASYSLLERKKWKSSGLVIHPFKLILSVIREISLLDSEQAWLSAEELAKVIVPMAGDRYQSPSNIARYVLRYRLNPLVVDGWPDCVPEANDIRFLGEYLRFLVNFGFLSLVSSAPDGTQLKRDQVRYLYIRELDVHILSILNNDSLEDVDTLINLIHSSDLTSSITTSALSRRNARPNQARFRRDLLSAVDRCPITGNNLPNVLQAAHIRPHSFNGPEDPSNGLPLRADIHILFDAGLLNIRPLGLVGEYSKMCEIEIKDARVRENYRELIDKHITLPSVTDMDFVAWRYENRLLGLAV